MSFSYIETGLPWLNQYLARINVLAQEYNAVTLVRLESMALCLESSTLPLTHCAPSVTHVTYQKSLK